MNQETCKHCQTPLTHTRIDTDAGVFCCNGCEQVHAILNTADNQLYYQLCELQASTPPPAKITQSYNDFLAEISVPENLKTQGQWEENLHSVRMKSAEMHCSACTWLLEKALSEIEGVRHFELHFIEGSLFLQYAPTQVSLSKILGELARFGYTFHFSDSQTKSRPKKNHLLLRLAISGAVFGNVMMFSSANYFGLYTGMLKSWSQYFNLFSFFLNIPVITYCAFPFYQRALQGLKHKVLHMDLLVSLGVVLNFILSTFFLFQEKEVFFDGLSGIIFFLLIGRWAVQRFEHSLLPEQDWFTKLFPQQIRERKNEKLVWIKPEEIEAGMTLALKRGEYLPLNAKLLDAEAHFDPHFISGESDLKQLKRFQEIPAGYRVASDQILVEAKESWKESSILQMKKRWEELLRKQDFVPKPEKIVPWFITGVLIIATLAGIYKGQADLWKGLETAGVLLILSCPCALALARPLSLGLGMKRARDAGFMIRRESVLEKLLPIKTVLLDKTGTLTFTQKRITTWQVLDDSYGEGTVKSLLKSLCSSSNHPISQSVFTELHEVPTPYLATGVKEIPGRGLEGTYQVNDKEVKVSFFKSVDPNFQNTFSINGKAVLHIGFSDEVRPSVPESLQELAKLQKETLIVSGDKQQRVDEFARTVGITKALGDLSPEGKLEVLKEKQKKGAVLAFGDGLNDSLILSAADVGVLAKGGLEGMAEGINIISLNEDLKNFSFLFRVATAAFQSQKRAYFVSIFYNILVVTFALLDFVAPLVAAIAMPLSSLSVCFTVLLSIPKPAR